MSTSLIIGFGIAAAVLVADLLNDKEEEKPAAPKKAAPKPAAPKKAAPKPAAPKPKYTHADLKRNKAQLETAYNQLNGAKRDLSKAYDRLKSHYNSRPYSTGSWNSARSNPEAWKSKRDSLKADINGGWFSGGLKGRRNAAAQHIANLKREREAIKSYLFKK